MTTTTAVLDTNQYVKINNSPGSFFLQSHRDTVRIVSSDVKPARSNKVFHEIGGVHDSIYQIPYSESNIWALAMSDKSRLTITKCDECVASGINLDAWGKNKVSVDKSLLHGMFTFNVPKGYWKESIDSVEQIDFVNATSINGELHLSSSGVQDQLICLDSFRNPRYQPNRGHLYSVSILLPNPTALGQRDFGTFTEEAGLFFRLRGDGSSWSLFAVSRTTIDSVTIDSEIDITTSVPTGFNPEKGNIYDIQAQMRMVGDFNWFIGSSITGLSTLVHKTKNINMLDNLSVFNPAMPVAFSCINQGDDVTLVCGCVDVTSEGGENERGVYGSISIDNLDGEVLVSGYNTPIIVIKNRKTIPGTDQRNTRDVLSLLATGYSDNKSILRIWSTRDESAITLNDQDWKPFRDGILEYIEYDPDVVSMEFDTDKAELIFGSRVAQDTSYSTSALFEGRTDIFQTPGDILIITIHRENGNAVTVGATYEFAEEV